MKPLSRNEAAARLPSCLVWTVDDAKDLSEAVHLARIELDLIEEGQEAAEHYTKRDIAAIKKWIAANELKSPPPPQ